MCSPEYILYANGYATQLNLTSLPNSLQVSQALYCKIKSSSF